MGRLPRRPGRSRQKRGRGEDQTAAGQSLWQTYGLPQLPHVPRRPLAQVDRPHGREEDEPCVHRPRRGCLLSQPPGARGGRHVERGEDERGARADPLSRNGADSQAQLLHMPRRLAEELPPHGVHARILQGRGGRNSRCLCDIRQAVNVPHRLRRGGAGGGQGPFPRHVPTGRSLVARPHIYRAPGGAQRRSRRDVVGQDMRRPRVVPEADAEERSTVAVVLRHELQRREAEVGRGVREEDRLMGRAA